MTAWFESQPTWLCVLLTAGLVVVGLLAAFGGLMVFWITQEELQERRWSRNHDRLCATRAVIDFLRWGAEEP